ncbi:ORF1003 [White spot syndrome virus]|uniref:ORF1003 n=1 Tax=White spot syndrome virus TaxID=342409 RepID=A0A2D3I704_9VIRU|nr:ORF1003 [White spot syndrome virus]
MVERYRVFPYLDQCPDVIRVYYLFYRFLPSCERFLCTPEYLYFIHPTTWTCLREYGTTYRAN